ncbi:MAG: DNA primase [Candidatus Cryptobacteroides sp.]
MIPRETVEKVLDAAQIVDVVGDFVDLKRRGANWIACCPFHNEKTPSFSVSPAKGIFKCFGCGKAGTAVEFVMEHESMTFPEAIRYLAKKYHIEVNEKEETPEDIAKMQHRESLMVVSAFAGDFFRRALREPEGMAIAYEYFNGKRRLEESTIEKYGLGWAPQSRDRLAKEALAAGYKSDYLVETGLCIKRDDGTLVDRFFDRVIFPIHSVTGQVIAFGGRTLKTDKSVAKYVNSPETEIYVKNKSLYGIYFAKNEIARQRKCILVEGYLDVLSMHQLGILNVVASSGTSLTTGQVALIKRFADDVTIIYDGDSAGIHAAIRGIGLVLKGGLNVRVVLLPDGEDPDSFACSHTLEQVRDYISSREQDFIGFMTDRLLGEAGGDPLKRASLVNEVADTIALIPDQIIRAMYIQTCALKFGIEEKILYDRVRKSREAMLEAEKKQRDREADRQKQESAGQVNAGTVAGTDVEPATSGTVPPEKPAPSVNKSVSEEEVLTASAERELLRFLLEYGEHKLVFEKDSRFFVDGEPPTVAEFILDTLDGNSLTFRNSRYARLLDEYTRLFDSGLPQGSILSRLCDNPDPLIASVSRDLLVDKYNLTVKNLENSLTAASTMLVTYVPKSLLKLQLMNLEIGLKSLQRELMEKAPDADAQMELMQKIAEGSKMKAAISRLIQQI